MAFVLAGLAAFALGAVDFDLLLTLVVRREVVVGRRAVVVRRAVRDALPAAARLSACACGRSGAAASLLRSQSCLWIPGASCRRNSPSI